MSMQVPGEKNFIPQEPNKSQGPQEAVKKDAKESGVQESRKKQIGTFDAGLIDTHQAQVAEINDIAKEILSLRKDLLEEKTLTSEQKESLSHILKDVETFVQSHESLQGELRSIKDQLASPTLKWGDSTAILQKQRGIQDKIQQLQKQGEQIVARPELEVLKNVRKEVGRAENQYDTLFSKYEAKQDSFLKNHQKMTNQGYIEGRFHQLKEEISGLKNIGIEKETGNSVLEEKREKIAILQKEIQFQIDNSEGEKLSRTTILQNRVRGFFSAEKIDTTPSLFVPSSYVPRKSTDIQATRWDSTKTPGKSAHALNEITQSEKEFVKGLKKGIDLLEKMASDKNIKGKAKKQVGHLHAMHTTADETAKKLSAEFEAMTGNTKLTNSEKVLELAEIYNSPLFERYIAVLEVCVRSYQPNENQRLLDKFLKGKKFSEDEVAPKINDELIKVVQRLPRHVMLIEALLKEVPAGTEEHEKLTKTLDYVKEATKSVNAGRK